MRSVLILGANSDIAVAIAYKFAAENFKVILAGRNIKNLEILRNDLTIKFGIKASAIIFDALDFGSHRQFVEGFSEFPDVTVCVFGYLGDQKVAEDDFTESQKIISTNFTGAVSILNFVGNLYENRRNGTIVGISSVAGERGRQSNYIYGSAKSAFSTYLSGLRNRLVKNNVHVVTVKPGFVNTKMTEGLDLPPLLTANPDDVAHSVYKAVVKKQNEIYVLGLWRLIMWIIRNIPEFIFKKLNL